MSDQTELHRRLRFARENSGLSQGQAARKLDMHRPTISEIEAGRRKVSADEIKEFADLYDVTLEWLLGEGSDDDAKIALAARELADLCADDLDKVIRLLKEIRRK